MVKTTQEGNWITLANAILGQILRILIQWETILLFTEPSPASPVHEQVSCDCQ